jgi:aspartyl-tRNA(Asn)/glutamyl-tRNA(Gln) amidotransferase subunit A
MPNQELCTLSIHELGRRISRKEISPVALTQAYLERIETVDQSLNAFVAVAAEQALADARRAEQEIVSGRYKGPLHGIPIAHKDLYDVRGLATTAGSKVFSGRIAEEDAHSVARLKGAGSIVIGKTNMHELAYGATGDQSAFGPTHNPWDTDRIPGGSSSGSAVAVAAGLCAAATGSDTGGSIRVPGALCGVVGIKPTFGRVSRHGLVALSWTMDHAGPITRTVTDAALMLGAMAGYDPRDPACVNRPVPDFTEGLGRDLSGMRIGIDRAWALSQLQPEVKTGFEAALALLRQLKAEIVEISLPRMAEVYDAAIAMQAPEATSLYEEALKSRPQDFSDRVRERLQRGFAITGIEYARARQLGELVRRDIEEMFGKISLIATPTCPVAATKLGQDNVSMEGEEKPLLGILSRFTRVFNLTGNPAITVPCGFSQEGLPVGLQLVGAAWNEAIVFQAAHAYEQATEWHRSRPKGAVAQ